VKAAEPVAKVCEAARKIAVKKQQDARNRSSPSFSTQLKKLIDRLEIVEATVSGSRRAAAEAATNKTTLAEQKKSLKALEALATEAETSALPLGDEQPSDQTAEVTAESIRKAQVAIDAWQKQAEVLANNPHGGMELAMGRLLEEAKQLQARLSDAKALAGASNERALCRIFAREVPAEVAKAEEVMRKAEEAEGPFLKGLEVISVEQSSSVIASCEAASATARSILQEVQSYVQSRHKEASAFTGLDGPAKAHLQTLSQQLSRLQGLVDKLDQYDNDTASRKRIAERNADGERAAKMAKQG